MKNQQQRTIGKNQKNRKMFGIALFLTFFCIFVLFVVRFFVIATTKDVQNRNLQTMASRMYTSKRIIEAKRGTNRTAKWLLGISHHKSETFDYFNKIANYILHIFICELCM